MCALFIQQNGIFPQKFNDWCWKEFAEYVRFDKESCFHWNTKYNWFNRKHSSGDIAHFAVRKMHINWPPYLYAAYYRRRCRAPATTLLSKGNSIERYFSHKSVQTLRRCRSDIRIEFLVCRKWVLLTQNAKLNSSSWPTFLWRIEYMPAGFASAQFIGKHFHFSMLFPFFYLRNKSVRRHGARMANINNIHSIFQ